MGAGGQGHLSRRGQGREESKPSESSFSQVAEVVAVGRGERCAEALKRLTGEGGAGHWASSKKTFLFPDVMPQQAHKYSGEGGGEKDGYKLEAQAGKEGSGGGGGGVVGSREPLPLSAGHACVAGSIQGSFWVVGENALRWQILLLPSSQVSHLVLHQGGNLLQAAGQLHLLAHRVLLQGTDDLPGQRGPPRLRPRPSAHWPPCPGSVSVAAWGARPP